MYTLTEENLKTIKASLSDDQPTINGVSIIDFIIELSEINDKVISAPIIEGPIVEELIAEEPIAEQVIVEEPIVEQVIVEESIAEAQIEIPVETPIVYITAE
jgi:hypothetical protein